MASLRYRMSVPATLYFDVYADTDEEATRKATDLAHVWNNGLRVVVNDDRGQDADGRVYPDDDAKAEVMDAEEADDEPDDLSDVPLGSGLTIDDSPDDFED